MPIEKAQQAPTAPRDDVATLRVATCPTLSGSSTLKYAVGVDGSGQPRLRIISNDGGGLFSSEWTRWKDIQAALERVAPITSPSLAKLFTRKSANTPGFMLAVLVKEKLVDALSGKSRHFKQLDPAPFLDRVAKLAKFAKPVTTKPAKKPAAKKALPKKNAKK